MFAGAYPPPPPNTYTESKSAPGSASGKAKRKAGLKSLSKVACSNFSQFLGHRSRARLLLYIEVIRGLIFFNYRDSDNFLKGTLPWSVDLSCGAKQNKTKDNPKDNLIR